MQQIFFLTISILIFCFIIYLAVSAIIKGSKAKNDLSNNPEEANNFAEELEKLNELFKSGALTKEEFEIAKKKILED